MNLVNIFKSAANNYGYRASAAAARPGRQLQEHHRPPAQEGPRRILAHRRGHVFSFAWKGDMHDVWQKCPMHEDPLHLVPHDLRRSVLERLNANLLPGQYKVTIRGDLCPFCRQMYNERLAKYDGDWQRMLEEIKVYRLILSKQDRIGIGTFRPRDEKNQDSTELTGTSTTARSPNSAPTATPASSTSRGN